MISLEREKLLSELEQKIGYSFRSRALLDRALTHRSFANERVAEKCQHNEAMEFLGDSVLGFVVSAWLLERFPALSEGKLSKIKSYLVSEASLVELAEDLELGRYILLNRGEEKTGGRRKRALLADAYEALLGAMYIDGGVTIAERFLRREMRYKLNAIDPGSMIGADYKSALQERLQAAGGPVPEYAVVEVLGPDHRRTFRVELRVGGRPLAMGEGHTIKLAQQEAAREALTSSDILLPLEQQEPDVESAGDYDFEPVDRAAPLQMIESEAMFDNDQLSLTADDEPEEDELDEGNATQNVSSARRSQIIPSAQNEVVGASCQSDDRAAISTDAEMEDEAHIVATDA